jgi:hypothetical protein
MQDEVKVGGHYLNKKNRKIYVVLLNALSAWDTCQNLVVYQREGKGDAVQIWVRSLTEFKEKFECMD